MTDYKTTKTQIKGDFSEDALPKFSCVPPTAIPLFCPSRTTVVLCSRGTWPLILRRCLETCCWPKLWILRQMGCPHPTSSKGKSSSRWEPPHKRLNFKYYVSNFLPSSFFISQHKKLAEGSAYEEVSTSTPYSENDISNSIKNGILFLEDPINHVRKFMMCKWIWMLH